MPKRPTLHRIKRHDVYSLAEAGEAAGVHRKTVARWVRACGLPADTSRKPWLILRRNKARQPLQDGFIYCLPCRAARRPDGDIADYKAGTAGNGQLIGLCPDCGRLMHRFMRRDDLDREVADLEVAIR